jgi:hypothetical protein
VGLGSLRQSDTIGDVRRIARYAVPSTIKEQHALDGHLNQALRFQPGGLSNCGVRSKRNIDVGGDYHGHIIGASYVLSGARQTHHVVSRSAKDEPASQYLRLNRSKHAAKVQPWEVCYRSYPNRGLNEHLHHVGCVAHLCERRRRKENICTAA